MDCSVLRKLAVVGFYFTNNVECKSGKDFYNTNYDGLQCNLGHQIEWVQLEHVPGKPFTKAASML